MTTNSYLLPCDCGRKVTVQPRQAGEEVRCACGKALDVPTMLAMAKLEPAKSEPSPERSPAAWGWRQGILLLGIAIVMGAVVAGVQMARIRPQPPPPFEPAKIREMSRRQTPVEAWRLWRTYRVIGMDRERLGMDEKYREDNVDWWMITGVVGLIGLVGIGLMVVPLLSRQRLKPSDQGSGIRD